MRIQKILARWTVSILLVVLVNLGSVDATSSSAAAASPDSDQELPENDRLLESAPDVSSRIVGGTNAAVGEFPYFVQANGCGGSMIWKDMIITAAHCQGSPWQNDVIVGAYRYWQASDGAEVVSVKKQIVHPKYEGTSTFHYDYMVVVLKRKASNINARNVVKLASGRPYPKETLTAIGMGMLQEDSYRFPSILQKVDVGYITAKTCANKYYTRAKFGYDLIYRDTMICAKSQGRDSCQGDSGGPLLKTNGYQVGIVSWGIGCAENQYPGVYSLVPAAYNWIYNQVCIHSRSPPSKRCGRRRKKRALARRLKGLERMNVSSNSTTTSTNCSDSDETFDLEDKFDDKDCAWLESNRFSVTGEDDLCDWLHIAYRCPSTCGSCGEFADD